MLQPLLGSGRLPRLPKRGSRPAPRTLQILLGAAWLLDAALQFQPYMFSRDFVTQVIEPPAAGDPAVVAGPILWSAHLMAGHVVVFNAIFAVTRLMIAAGLFCRRTVRLALAASIAWSASVWWLGEGMGAVLTGGSPLAGLPGAVILYALIAVLVWPAREDTAVAPLGRLAPRLAWLALWAGFGWYQLRPANRAPGAVSHVFAGAAAGEPGPVRFLDGTLAAVTAGHGLAASVVLYVLCAVAGLGIFSARLTRPALLLGSALGLLFWAAEGFGGIATGRATDPNSGPLLILLAACYWPPATARRPRARPGRSALLAPGRPAIPEQAPRLGESLLP